ncbi:MAG TPA: extracellular solute-binding protein [Chloroflexota bacterium]
MHDRLTRRDVVRLTAASALVVTAACSPAAPPSAGRGSGTAAAGGSSTSRANPFPTYMPVVNGPRPDFHLDDPRFDDGFNSYPSNPIKAVAETPGAGSTINILNRAYFPPPTPYDQNPTWQEVNRQLGANLTINVVAGADYQTKFVTTMAGDDLPDVMHIYNGYALAPNLQQFFKSKCADLTPYLAGDAARDYPYLASIPTYSWKNSVSAIDGALYLIPIHRHLPTFPSFGGYFMVNTDIWNSEIGEGVVPQDAADFKRILSALTRPRENRYGVGNAATAGVASENGPFGLSTYAAMFGAPNNWKLDASGKLIRNRETPEYKAAVDFVRDLMTSGVFPPDVGTMTGSTSRPLHAQGRFVVSVDGYGNSWVDLLQRGRQFNNRFHMLPMFAATAGGKPQAFLSHGYISMNVLKKTTPDRIKEILRIMNFLAAPFGSQEDLLLTYGLEGHDFTRDANGNPQPTQEGLSRSSYVPWRYIAQHPWVNYQADLPGYPKLAFDAEQMIMPLGVADPTDGYFSATAWGKGQTADARFQDGVIDIILSRRPMSDYDDLVKAWQTEAGDTVRKEFLDSMAAARA